ncbi:MAG: hypothetical protein C4291_08980 [Candidatus Dadabacteria bacterium]
MSIQITGNCVIHKALIAFLLLIAISPINTQGDDISNNTVANIKSLHRGKSGIYVRLNRRMRKRDKVVELIKTNPLVDSVIISVPWREVEPQPGVYSFDSLLNEVNQWGKSGKGVIINLLLYGQGVDDTQTPPWIYNQPGVRAIYFKGGGEAKGKRIRVPEVWDEGFIEKNLEPMIKAFAKTFNGNPYVWYIMPGLGHIGNLTAQPSEDGGRAFLEAGFTAEKWKNYCRHMMTVYRKNFTNIPLLIKAAGIFIKNPNRDNYRKEASELITEFGREGTAIIGFGLDADMNAMTQVYNKVSGVIPYARMEITRIGLGNDWPLWVPERRRGKEATRNRDEQFLRKSLNNAFGGTDGIPEIPTTIYFAQEPEILASNPNSKNYRPEVAEILKEARDRLKKNDIAIFGSPPNAPHYKSSSAP